MSEDEIAKHCERSTGYAPLSGTRNGGLVALDQHSARSVDRLKVQCIEVLAVYFYAVWTAAKED